MPVQLVNACKAVGRDFFVLGIQDHADPVFLANLPHRIVRLGAINDALKTLREQNVAEIVLAGRVGRPSIKSLRPDFAASKLIARFGSAIFNGDDTLLKSVVKFLEDEGFSVVGADDVLESLLAPNAVLTKRKPTEQQLNDIRLGFTAARTLGELDIGQAIVIENGYVLAVEAAEGTDALMERAGNLKQFAAGEGVLVKVKKPSQERRIDLPTIGPTTVENAYKAGLAGIAVEAGHSVILNIDEVKTLADSFSLFVVGIEHE